MYIQENKRFTAGQFRINKEGWVVFDLKKRNITVTIQDFPVEGKFCTKIRDGVVQTPRLIAEKYGLYGSVGIAYIANNAFVIEKSCTGIIPKFPQNISYTDTFEEGEVKYETTMPLCGHALTLNRKGQYMVDLQSSIKVHIGKCVEIIPYKECEYSVDTLKDIYGSSLQRCDAEYFEYKNPNTSDSQFHIPAFFASRSGIKKDGDVRVVVLQDGRVLLTPIPEVDDITQEKIFPEKEGSTKVTVCNDCNEDDDLKELIIELKKMQNLISEQQKTNELLKLEMESCIEENRELKKQVNELSKVIRFVR